MRPKNNILMFCPTEEDASVYRFVIKNHNLHRNHNGRMFNVVTATTEDETLRLLQRNPENHFSAILIFGTGPQGAQALAVDLERAYPVVYVECVLQRPRPEDWLRRMDAACCLTPGPKPRNPETRAREKARRMIRSGMGGRPHDEKPSKSDYGGLRRGSYGVQHNAPLGSGRFFTWAECGDSVLLAGPQAKV